MANHDNNNEIKEGFVDISSNQNNINCSFNSFAYRRQRTSLLLFGS